MATQSKVKVPPFAPASYKDSEIAAIKALAKGEASPGQQTEALRWIVEKAAGTYDEPFVPGSTDVTQYRLGRRNVGLQIVKLINMRDDQSKENING